MEIENLPGIPMKELSINQKATANSGIYALKNIQTKLIYIGQTINFEHRFHAHINAFKANRNVNKDLQSDYDLQSY